MELEATKVWKNVALIDFNYNFNLDLKFVWTKTVAIVVFFTLKYMFFTVCRKNIKRIFLETFCEAFVNNKSKVLLRFRFRFNLKNYIAWYLAQFFMRMKSPKGCQQALRFLPHLQIAIILAITIVLRQWFISVSIWFSFCIIWPKRCNIILISE